MKTVTNMYILNLAIADFLFLMLLPFLITTYIMRTWVFGFAMCKIFFILTSINWFTSVFTLTVMSADRYLAVCHPITSMRYRTPLISLVVCFCVWCLSVLVMLPIVLYATTVPSGPSGEESCTLQWPPGQPIEPDKAFIWYTLLLGFAIPVALTSVFYALVVLRLKTVGPKTKSKERKKSHKRVTKLVLTVIAVYVVCWLPYWVFQVYLTFTPYQPPKWVPKLYQMITVMSYANSMLNPLLYAFLSDNFRKSFMKAFSCATAAEVNGALQNEHSTFPRNKSMASSTLTTTTGIPTATNRTKTSLGPNEDHLEDEEELEQKEDNIELVGKMANHCDETGELNQDEANEKTKFIQANHDDIKHETRNGTPTSV